MDLFWLWLLPYAVKLLISAYTMLYPTGSFGMFVVHSYVICFLCSVLCTMIYSSGMRRTYRYAYEQIHRYVQRLIDLFRPYNRAEYKALLESEFQRMSMMLDELGGRIEEPEKRNPLHNTTTAVFFSNAVKRALEDYDIPKAMQIIPVPYVTQYRLSRRAGSMAFHITDVLNIRFKVLRKPYRIVYDGAYQSGRFRLIRVDRLLADEAYSYYKLNELTKTDRSKPFYILFEHNGSGAINELQSSVLSTPNNVGLSFDLFGRLGSSFGQLNTVSDLMLVDDYYSSYIYNDDDYGFDRSMVKQYGNAIVIDIF